MSGHDDHIPALLPHQQRVLCEHAALAENHTKLRIFLRHPDPALPAPERARLVMQSTLQAALLDVLEQRIEAFAGTRWPV